MKDCDIVVVCTPSMRECVETAHQFHRLSTAFAIQRVLVLNNDHDVLVPLLRYVGVTSVVVDAVYLHAASAHPRDRAQVYGAVTRWVVPGGDVKIVGPQSEVGRWATLAALDAGMKVHYACYEAWRANGVRVDAVPCDILARWSRFVNKE